MFRCTFNSLMKCGFAGECSRCIFDTACSTKKRWANRCVFDNRISVEKCGGGTGNPCVSLRAKKGEDEASHLLRIINRKPLR